MALFALGTLSSCSPAKSPHDHPSGHHGGHDHHDEAHGHHDEAHEPHDEAHGHHDGPVHVLTLWSPHHELFAEHPPATVGKTLDVLAHLTLLDGFLPLEEGRISLRLDGPRPLVATSTSPIRSGIFRLETRPQVAGAYTGFLEVEGSLKDRIGPIRIEVFDGLAEARAHVPPESEDTMRIEFLKEQQWKVPFSTAFVKKGQLTPVLEVPGRIRTPPGGQALVGAPVAGRLVAPPSGFPSPWTKVDKGEVLATLSPTPTSPEASLRAKLVVAEAEARAEAAQVAFARAERLIGDEAISRREFEDSHRERAVSRAALEAARANSALYAGASRSTGRGTWQLSAPISGLVASVEALPGATVAPGQALFRIVDPSEIWIVGRVPESLAGRLRVDRPPSLRPAGARTWINVELGEGGAVLGRTVDEASRTVELIYPLAAPRPDLRIGGLVQMALPVDDDFEGRVLPSAAVIDREGRSVVYVQVDGEHFEERTVRVGPRSGGRMGIRSGVEVGERVVVEGARLIRLAEGAQGGGGHGHIH